MSPMRFPRVTIIHNQEKGWLNTMKPHENFGWIYEIHGDSGEVYFLKGEEFYYDCEEKNESEWQGQ